MPKLKINDIEIEVPQGTNILQAAEQLGIEIPRFCYHDKLSVPANCRMCLVEVKGGPPKPQASCALACADNMEVFTNSEMVHKARKGVMEFLLINHPLDCPICDQGGECDLQDQAVAYGFDRSRYFEAKRAVKDKELGPVIKTVMTRCIQCTRCVRFASEIAGVDDLGLLNRGEDVEIGTYVEKACASELSGNLVDVCPVGALTSKPYEFTARPWELRKTDSIDVMDAVGSNIRVDARGNAVMRILPRLNESVNEEWLADKSRLACDGLKVQRLDKPYVRDTSGSLRECAWDEALIVAAGKLKALEPKQIAALVGDLVDIDSTFALKQLMSSLGVTKMECRVDGGAYDAGQPCGYRFNTTIAGIEQATSVVLVGTNPRHEAPLINARIRKTWLANRIKIYVIGEKIDLNYPYEHLGTGADALEALNVEGERPMMIVGQGALRGLDAQAVQALARKKAVVNENWNGFNVLHTAAGRVGALTLGFTSAENVFEGTKAFWLHGVDTDIIKKIPADAFVIYQGHHGDVGADRADVIFPGVAYTEKTALYMNTEGRVQMARAAISPLGQAKEDWKIIRAFSETMSKPLPFNTHTELRAALSAVYPAMNNIGEIVPASWAEFGKAGKIETKNFVNAISNYYQTCPISRASVTMAECTDAFVKVANSKAA